MVYRKGELNPGRIDSGWRHQVALPESVVVGRNWMIMHRFCNGMSLCPRRQHYRKGNCEYVVFCFAELRDAEYFQMHFDGELMTPDTRPPRYPKMPKRTT